MRTVTNTSAVGAGMQKLCSVTTLQQQQQQQVMQNMNHALHD